MGTATENYLKEAEIYVKIESRQQMVVFMIHMMGLLKWQLLF